ncbi:MAG: GNAT family N-acetyltransferase [Haliscomenobacter sp.]|nr:GNAT family N-acetyltransferase [Haliscomenobacter sp.]MBP9075956.1 GNAT family N-acetyltransferase [Haliscomenobacter sp.]MBP9873299.1 GNAT family N-acetyltransferase [Haliscomenobacter sp.]
MRRQLEKIFNPRSIAVIGASNKPDTVGNALISNLLNGGFAGKVFPVNLRHDQILGLQAYSRIDKVPEKVDLAVIAIPAFSVPDVVEECGKAGVGGLVIISAGFLEVGQEGKMHADKILEICRRYGMRVIGPNCLGFIRPVGKINASFAAEMAFPGNLALISQSGALLTSILDWSVAQRVGFSYFVSIGSMIDVDFADLIDYFGTDPQTSCILIYMESLVHARRFMSAARSFARNKPIIVLKAGRSFEGGQAALSHTGSMAGNDEVYDAAFRRAGIIRVDTIAQLFNIAQALALQNRPRGNRLAIITNAGGPGVLATDYLIRNGGQLARLSPKSLDQLNQLLPSTWSRGNPIDLLGDASPEKYRKALHICIHDPGVDAALVILTPQYMTDPKGCAQAVAEAAKGSPKPVLASWMGEDEVHEGREVFESGRVPNYRFPESAVDAFLRIWRYTRDLQLLYETPPAIPKDFSPDTDAARQVVAGLLGKGRQLLTEMEAKNLLSAYQIPVIKSHLCQNPKEAIDAAEMLGYPVVLKIVSPDISHKTDVGGVMLDLQNQADVQRAYYTLHERVALRRPAARLEGVLVEPMIRKPFELLLGAKKDPVFGPVIAFGHGGTGAEVFKDFQLGLPPLNMALAQQIVEGTRFFPLLRGYRGLPGVNLKELDFLLCKFAYLLMDIPEIREIDINPFLADHLGGLVVDARIVLDPVAGVSGKPYQHLVISPYPGRKYSRSVTLKDGATVHLRPIRPEDEPAMEEMLQNVSNDSLYMRFFGFIPKMSHAWMVRFTHIDYDRELAIVAEVDAPKGGRQFVGVVRLIEDAWRENAEYSILVADHFHGRGLGNMLTDYIFDIARERGIRKIVASVLPNNTPMIHMFERRGFRFDRSAMDIYDVELELVPNLE